MLDFKEVRKECARCGLLTREQCLSCPTYITLNTPCYFCDRIGGVVPFTKSTSKGTEKILVCPKCLEKLT